MVSLLLTLALLGLLVWAITRFIPMPDAFRKVIVVVGVVIAVLLSLSAFNVNSTAVPQVSSSPVVVNP